MPRRFFLATYVHPAVGLFGDDGCVVRTQDVVGIEVPNHLEVSLGGVLVRAAEVPIRQISEFTELDQVAGYPARVT